MAASGLVHIMKWKVLLVIGYPTRAFFGCPDKSVILGFKECETINESNIQNCWALIGEEVGFKHVPSSRARHNKAWIKTPPPPQKKRRPEPEIINDYDNVAK